MQVPKAKLNRFLEVEKLRLALLISDFGISESAAMSTRAYMSRWVDVPHWQLDSTQQFILLPDGESIEAMHCAECETELSRERQRVQEWRQKVEEEKAKIGECVYRRSCKLTKPVDSRRSVNPSVTAIIICY